MVTDPPYGIGVDKSMHEKSGQQYGNAAAPKGNYEYSNWDSCSPTAQIFDLIMGCSNEQIIFGGNFFQLPPTRCLLIWDKQNGDNAFADCEVAWTNLDKPIRIKRHMWNGMLRKNGEHRWGHPTQKPLEVMEWVIQQVDKETKIILDPFGGSGTTALACKELRKDCILIEISEKYCQIAKTRLQNTIVPMF